MKDAPIDGKMLYDVVSKAHGNLSVIPIKTQYIYSSDDTVMYVFEGKRALKRTGTNSKYQSDDKNMMSGMKVKLTLTFLAIGVCALILIYVCGLTPKELQKKACIILQVEGVCIGGGDVSIGNKEKGYIMFMRNNADADKQRYKYYRDEMLIPFIQSTRKEYDGFLMKLIYIFLKN